MALPSVSVPVGNVKFRFGEKYISEATNEKFLGLPYGVYYGFVPSVSGNVITLAPDSQSGISFLRVLSNLDFTTSVDVITQSALTLNLSDYIAAYNASVPGVVFPLFMFATASYQFGSSSSARVEFRNVATTSDDSVLLGQVFYDGSALTVSSTVPLERANPFAFGVAPLGYGFMRDGQANGLLDGLLVSGEVAAARTDLSSFGWPALADRLEEDFSAESMAGRLAKSVRVIRSNVHQMPISAFSLNVSASFSEVTRQFAPALTFEGGGTETQIGVITEPLDAVRNVAVVINDDTKDRPIDDDINRRIVFGRLAYAELALTGACYYTNGSPNVAGFGTFFLSEVQAGDLVQGADGLYYSVDSVTDDLALVLTTNFGGTSDLVSNAVRRRFTLNFRKVSGTTEENTTLPAGTDIQFFFGAFCGLHQSVFDATMLMYQGGEPVQIGIATDVTSGRVLIDPNTDATPLPLAGAIQTIKDSGFTVAANVYDMDFDGAELGSPGVVDVTQRGLTGDQGPDGIGAPGPVGPQGPQGIGFNGGTNWASTVSPNHMLIRRNIIDHALVGHNFTYFHAVNSLAFGIDEILWATAGVYHFDHYGGAREQGESWRLIQVVRDTPTQVTLSAATEVIDDLRVRVGVFLNIAGRT